jgi:hypothetical protein
LGCACGQLYFIEKRWIALQHLLEAAKKIKNNCKCQKTSTGFDEKTFWGGKDFSFPFPYLKKKNHILN